MNKILHKLAYAQNPLQYEVHPSYYEEILCKVLTVKGREEVGRRGRVLKEGRGAGRKVAE